MQKKYTNVENVENDTEGTNVSEYYSTTDVLYCTVPWRQ